MLNKPLTNPELPRFLRIEISLRRSVFWRRLRVSPFSGGMLAVKTVLNLILILASCAGVALSKTPPQGADDADVRIVSSFVADGAPVPEKCREEAHVFARSLVRYPRPAAWHWVLICDEAGWRRFLRFSGRYEQAAIYASTDLSGRTTYIRGAKLLYPYDLHAGPDDVIAHELAHIRLQSSSEACADGLALIWQSVVKPDLP
jgi:hypothetical protein